MHIIKAKVVDREAANSHSPCKAGIASTIARIARTTGIVGLGAIDAGAKGVRRRGAGARRVFPFRFTGQAVGPAGLRAQPARVGFGIVPAHVDHRPSAPTPAPERWPARF